MEVVKKSLEQPRRDFNQLNPVDGTLFSQLWCQQHGSGMVCHVTGHTLNLRGLSHQALTLLRVVRFIAWCLRGPFLGEYQWGPRHFWSHQACLGYSPVPRPTLKKALCLTRPDGGTVDKYQEESHLSSFFKNFYSIF